MASGSGTWYSTYNQRRKNIIGFDWPSSTVTPVNDYPVEYLDITVGVFSASATSPYVIANAGFPRTVYLLDWYAYVAGSTAWTSAGGAGNFANIVCSDQSGNNYFSIPLANLTANAYISKRTSGVAIDSAWMLGPFGPSPINNALQVVGDGVALGGSNVLLTFQCVIR